MRMLKPALTALAIAIMAAPALAQIPRAPDGKPDLTGVWTHASVTPLQRAPENKTLAVSEAEATRIAGGFTVGGIKEEGYKTTYSDPTKGAPPKGGDDFGVQAYFHKLHAIQDVGAVGMEGHVVDRTGLVACSFGQDDHGLSGLGL